MESNAVTAAASLSAADRCRDVEPLWALVVRYPALRDALKHFSPQFVPVMLNTCTIPRDVRGHLRDDCLVYGFYFVDRDEVRKPHSSKAIRQDYFVVWPSSMELRYYSGAKRSWRGKPIHWRNITEFCSEFRDYGCKGRPKKVLPDHHYALSDHGLRTMRPQPVWRIAFDLAIAIARANDGTILRA